MNGTDDIVEKLLTSILSKNITNLSEPFIKAALNRLIYLGYEIKETDDWQICFCIKKVENHIKSYCNILEIPEGLYEIAIDNICGEFLFSKKQSGNLEISNLDLSNAVRRIQEGDTTVEFSENQSDSEKLDIFINNLIKKGESDLICFRKLKW